MNTRDITAAPPLQTGATLQYCGNQFAWRLWRLGNVIPDFVVYPISTPDMLQAFDRRLEFPLLLIVLGAHASYLVILGARLFPGRFQQFHVFIQLDRLFAAPCLLDHSRQLGTEAGLAYHLLGNVSP